MDISNLFFILDNCNGLQPIVNFIKSVYTIIQWGIPIVLVVYGGFDLAKAVIASDDKEIKAAATKLVKRLIAAVAIFLLTTLINVVIGWAADAQKGSEAGDADGTWLQCWKNSGSASTHDSESEG